MKYVANSKAIVLAGLISLCSVAYCSNFQMTDKGFINAGANEVTGEIASVNVTATTSTQESGTVTIQVTDVLAGNVSAQMIQFPYTKALVETDSPGNWDLISPLGESLEDAVGTKLLIFFMVANDTYSLYQASNSVQALSRKLLLGQISSIHRSRHGSWLHGESVEIQFQVKETVVGWTDGTTVTLKIDNVPYAIARSFFLDELCSKPNKSTIFLVSASDRKVTDIKVADNSTLSAIKTWDAE